MLSGFSRRWVEGQAPAASTGFAEHAGQEGILPTCDLESVQTFVLVASLPSFPHMFTEPAILTVSFFVVRNPSSRQRGKCQQPLLHQSQLPHAHAVCRVPARQQQGQDRQGERRWPGSLRRAGRSREQAPEGRGWPAAIAHPYISDLVYSSKQSRGCVLGSQVY